MALDPGAACYITWTHVELTGAQREILERLLGSLSYVGRSESWVEARLYSDRFEAGVMCEPLANTTQSGDAVAGSLSLIPADEYKERRPWMEAIAYSTAEFQRDRRSTPPGMRLVQYVRPADAIMRRVPSPPRGHARTQAVLLGLDAPVLPLVTATIGLSSIDSGTAHAGIHKRLMRRSTNGLSEVQRQECIR